MKTVLIALDYDPPAEKIADLGYAMAKAMGANTTLLHVVSDPAYYTNADYSSVMGFAGYSNITPYNPENQTELKKSTQNFLDQTKKHLKDDNIQTLIKEGDFADSILEAANEIKADVIVMGSHRHSWLEDVLMGSVTEQVLNESKIPLFIIPTKSLA